MVTKFNEDRHLKLQPFQYLLLQWIAQKFRGAPLQRKYVATVIKQVDWQTVFNYTNRKSNLNLSISETILTK